MAGENTIIINQTLHGYRGGHKLLSSSIELSDLETRSMLLMSDYSGSGIEKGFTEYITGYPIPSSKFYVFAKTWYASEMARPGCVWTHSFLIDVTDLWSIRDMRLLLHLFKRPESISDFEGYTESQSIPTTDSFSIRYDLQDTFYSISCELYSHPELGLVLLGDSSLQYEDEILQIWNWQWPRMKRSFTFSTGSLSLRKFDDQPFDLQVLPAKRERSLSIGERDIFNIVNIREGVCENDWIYDYRLTELTDLQSHMVKYGSDVIGNRSNFVALFRSYQLMALGADLGLSSIKRFFSQNLTNPAQGRILKSYFINELLHRKSIDAVDTIAFLASSAPLSGIKWNYPSIVSTFFESSQINQFELISIISELSEQPKLQEAVLDILVRLDPKIWIDKIRLHEELCLKLLERSDVYEAEPAIWALDVEEQRTWFIAISKQTNPDWARVVTAMLQAESDLFANEVAEIAEPAVLSSIIQWVVHNGQPVTQGWYYIMKASSKNTTYLVMHQEILNREVIRIFLDASSPHDSMWLNISWEDISVFLNRVNDTRVEPEITGVYTFLITACFNNNFSQPEALISLLFQPLHDKLNYQHYESNSWERFKWDMGKELYGLIQQNRFSYYLQDKNQVPDWDRCEFLRRSLVAVFLKFEWHPETMLITVTDKPTFEKIVEYGVQLNGGYHMFQSLYFKLRNSDEYGSPFHYKVLKNALK